MGGGRENSPPFSILNGIPHYVAMVPSDPLLHVAAVVVWTVCSGVVHMYLACFVFY